MLVDRSEERCRRRGNGTARREFFRRILPLVTVVLLAGVAASFLQHGFLIGGERGIPLAGPDCHVALGHLLLLGFVAGYTMALVGGATGMVSLPYDMSVLGFATVSVSPTVQLETFLNPLGALRGFYRNGQWNRDFAWPLCAGAVVGAMIGPVVRAVWLRDPGPFKAAVGAGLLLVSGQMLYRMFIPARRRDRAEWEPGGTGSGREADGIVTLQRTWREVRIGYADTERRMSVPGLLVLGSGVGVIGTTLGVGGGFLLVPILVEVYRLPMRVVVAGSIPYVIVLSGAGLFSFSFVVPLLTGQTVPPEWAWGFFTGGAAILGSWLATHSQRWIPDRLLRGILGAANGSIGLWYIGGYV